MVASGRIDAHEFSSPHLTCVAESLLTNAVGIHQRFSVWHSMSSSSENFCCCSITFPLPSTVAVTMGYPSMNVHSCMSGIKSTSIGLSTLSQSANADEFR